MKILLTNMSPKKGQPTLGLPPPGGGGGEGDSAEGTQNFQKGRQATPPWGEGVQATKKKLGRGLCRFGGHRGAPVPRLPLAASRCGENRSRPANGPKKLPGALTFPLGHCSGQLSLKPPPAQGCA